MPSITIDDSTFARLQSHAVALVDTVDTVLNRALDALEGSGPNGSGEDPGEVDYVVDPRRIPDLTHTKVLAARVGGVGVDKPNWNKLLDRVIVRAMAQAGSFERLDRMCPANLANGPKTTEGYHHLPEIDVSVQGLSAKEACAALVETARREGTGVEITFLWRDKEGAAHPGRTGRLSMPGPASAA